MEIEKSAEARELSVRIQPFDDKYQESAYELISEMKKEVTGGKDDKPKERYKKIHENCQRFKNEDFWIAVDETTDKVIGTVGLRFLKDEVGQLIRMGVKSSYRGQGIAHRLMDELMAFAREQKYKEIYLTTGTGDYHKSARKLYESYNFKQINPVDLREDMRDLVIDEDEKKRIKNGEAVVYKTEQNN